MNYLNHKLKKLKYKLKYQQIINNKQTIFKKNDYAIYLPKNEKVKILDVHNDTEPYYTISLSSGQRQTVIKNLVPL